MKSTKLHNWLMFICGVIVFIFGILVFTMPSLTVTAVGIFAGIGILIEGISRIIHFFKDKKSEIPSGLILFGGIIDLVFGLIILLNLQATALVLCLLVGVWFLFVSIMRIVASFEMKKAGMQYWWLILVLGILSTILSFFVIWNPLLGAVLIVINVAIVLISSGLMIIAEAFSVRR